MTRNINFDQLSISFMNFITFITPNNSIHGIHLSISGNIKTKVISKTINIIIMYFCRFYRNSKLRLGLHCIYCLALYSARYLSNLVRVSLDFSFGSVTSGWFFMKSWYLYEEYVIFRSGYLKTSCSGNRGLFYAQK